MTAVLAGVGVTLVLAAGFAVLHLIETANAHTANLQAELDAAETQLRLEHNARERRWQVTPNPAPQPVIDWREWDLSVDGLPWRTWMYGMPTMDVVDDPDGCTPKVAPPRKVSPSVARAMSRITTGELHELVGI